MVLLDSLVVAGAAAYDEAQREADTRENLATNTSLTIAKPIAPSPPHKIPDHQRSAAAERAITLWVRSPPTTRTSPVSSGPGRHSSRSPDEQIRIERAVLAIIVVELRNEQFFE